MKYWNDTSESTALKMSGGYLVFSAVVSSLLIALIVFSLFDPGLFERKLRWIWLNRFFSQPQYYRTYLLISAGCIAIGITALLSGYLRRLFSHPLIFSLIFSVPFFIVRFSKFYGDSDDWVKAIKYRYFMSEPGATLIHHISYRLLHHPFNLGARSIIALTSSLAGFAALAVIALISNTIFKSSRQRMLFRLVFFFSGPMLLFFGYIENTPLLIPFELLYIFFMIRYLLNDATHYLVYASLILSVASIIHGSACFVLPSIFIALLAKYGFRWKKLLKYGSMALVVYLLPIALFVGWVFFVDKGGIAGGPWGNILGGGDRVMFVPIAGWSDPARYTMFSRLHFKDMFNILFIATACHILVAPLFLIVNAPSIRRSINPILFSYFIARILFLFLWNCDFGFLNDWDLMIPNALPLLLISAYAVSRGGKGLILEHYCRSRSDGEYLNHRDVLFHLEQKTSLPDILPRNEAHVL